MYKGADMMQYDDRHAYWVARKSTFVIVRGDSLSSVRCSHRYRVSPYAISHFQHPLQLAASIRVWGTSLSGLVAKDTGGWEKSSPVPLLM